MATAPVNMKNTKNEILQAYEDLLEETREKKCEDRKEQVEREERKKIVIQASESDQSKIVKQLADLKLEVVKSFDQLEDQLINERKKLSNLQEAIRIESKNLEDLYEIKANADTLAAFIAASKECVIIQKIKGTV